MPMNIGDMVFFDYGYGRIMSIGSHWKTSSMDWLYTVKVIDSKTSKCVYAVSAQDKSRVVAALQAAGIDPNAVLRETIQAKYEVREQYTADLADGTLDAIFGTAAEDFKQCVEVNRAGSTSIKFVNRSED